MNCRYESLIGLRGYGNGVYYGSRRSRSGQIFEFLGGLVIYSSYQVQRTTCLKSSLFLCTYPRKVFSAWTEVPTVSDSYLVPNGVYYGSRRSRSGQIFEILGGLVIYISYQVKVTTCLKSFNFLCAYPRKVFSAWTEV